MGRVNVTSCFIFSRPLGSNIQIYGVELALIEQGWHNVREDRQVSEPGERTWMQQRRTLKGLNNAKRLTEEIIKLTWLVLGSDPANRSHRLKQFTAL